MGIAFVIFVAVSAVFFPEEEEPSEKVELCDSLRDPANRSLTRGDFMRITGMENYEIQRYVRDRCPDQSDRVD
jgi:hypothetical protein